MANDLNTVGLKRCRFLTCKEMLHKEPGPDGTIHSGSGHFWCALTQRGQGPDGRFVTTTECNRERSCYQEL